MLAPGLPGDIFLTHLGLIEEPFKRKMLVYFGKMYPRFGILYQKNVATLAKNIVYICTRDGDQGSML
jgi:hypothetical protein